MSDHDDDLDDDDQDDGSGTRSARSSSAGEGEKTLRASSRKGQKATRELAFVKAGVNPADKKAAYFIKGYDGDLTPDAIKAAAEDAGFLEAKTEDVVTDEEKARAHRDRPRHNGGTPRGVEDLGAQMRPLPARKDLTLSQQKAQFDALVAQAGHSGAGLTPTSTPSR
jgi:hypothetical protein